jgi:hypothetical protein
MDDGTGRTRTHHARPKRPVRRGSHPHRLDQPRCANFATKAIAAGLAERTVRVAERQGQLMVEMVQAALREVDLSPEQASAFKAALARQARELTASPVG